MVSTPIKNVWTHHLVEYIPSQLFPSLSIPDVSSAKMPWFFRSVQWTSKVSYMNLMTKRDLDVQTPGSTWLLDNATLDRSQPFQKKSHPKKIQTKLAFLKILMEVKNESLQQDRYLSTRPIFHFHDYGRKSHPSIFSHCETSTTFFFVVEATWLGDLLGEVTSPTNFHLFKL